MHRLIYILFFSILFPQDLQVRIVSKMEMDVPVLGPVKIINDQTVAPGFFRSEEKIDADRFYASWLMDGETGEIMINGTDKIIKYDKEDEEYWLQYPEEYFKKPDTSSENSKSFSFSISSDEDDNTPPKFTRTGGKEIEMFHGFRTKKWITTISFSENKMVFEEWFVEKLPLMKLSDSLEFLIKTKFNPNVDSVEVTPFEFSSNIFIREMDTLTILEPIPGHAIKINFLVYEDDDDPKMATSFEILELYAEPVDTSYFTIPEDYERVEKE